MSGRVKNHFWDEINARAENEPCEPDAEQFYADMELERAKEVIRKAAARGQVKDDRHEPR